jgi:hypothetical protein
MSLHLSDRQLFFFDDQRVRYSLDQIRTLLKDGVATTPDTPIRITELAFRAEDLVNHVAPVLSNFLLPYADEEAADAGDLCNSDGIGRSNCLDATRGSVCDSNGVPIKM